jgi:transposase
MMCTLITTAKMNHVDPQAWLADTLGRIANHPVQELMPWNWAPAAQTIQTKKNAA